MINDSCTTLPFTAVFLVELCWWPFVHRFVHRYRPQLSLLNHCYRLRSHISLHSEIWILWLLTIYSPRHWLLANHYRHTRGGSILLSRRRRWCIVHTTICWRHWLLSHVCLLIWWWVYHLTLHWWCRRHSLRHILRRHLLIYWIAWLSNRWLLVRSLLVGAWDFSLTLRVVSRFQIPSV